MEKLRNYSDAELLEIILKGGKEAGEGFTEIYRRYSAKVHAYCVSMIMEQDIAEDIFQETFIRFYKSIDKNFVNINIPGYLMKTAKNLSLNYFRDKKQNIRIEDAEAIIADSNSYENTELINLIMRALDLLDDKYKEAFVLREFNGMSFQEIADIMDLSLTNSKSRVTRARQKLIITLEPYLNEMVK